MAGEQQRYDPAEQIARSFTYIRREYGPGAVRREGGFGWKDADDPPEVTDGR